MTTFTINFVRGFTHTDWVDNVDRVEAGGDNGFNGRFHALEADLDTVGATFDTVQSALNTLGQPSTKPVALSLSPVLTAVRTLPSWEQDLGEARKPPGAVSAFGVMAVYLPDGVTIQSLRVIGENPGAAGNLIVRLHRRSLDPLITTSEEVVSVFPAGDPFDVSSAPQHPARAIVDTDAFAYFIEVALDNANPGDTEGLHSFQIVHVLQ
jgi:hypothetical protein